MCIGCTMLRASGVQCLTISTLYMALVAGWSGFNIAMATLFVDCLLTHICSRASLGEREYGCVERERESVCVCVCVCVFVCVRVCLCVCV